MWDWAPFAFHVSYFWNASRTSATSWFLASDAHRSCFMTCSMFSNGISIDGRGNGLNIFTWNFFNVHVVYQLKNEFSSSQYFASRLLKQHFTWCRIYRLLWHKCSEGQRDLSINCSSTANEYFYLDFPSHMDASVWKQDVLLWIGCSWPRKLRF